MKIKTIRAGTLNTSHIVPYYGQVKEIKHRYYSDHTFTAICERGFLTLKDDDEVAVYD